MEERRKRASSKILIKQNSGNSGSKIVEFFTLLFSVPLDDYVIPDFDPFGGEDQCNCLLNAAPGCPGSILGAIVVTFGDFWSHFPTRGLLPKTTFRFFLLSGINRFWQLLPLQGFFPKIPKLRLSQFTGT